jgi:hypothetical protein
MAFIANTPILTDTGWKNIEDISGRDRVLVRNFIGDAEFIQPFAIKRKKYDGEVINIGAKDWSFTVTPNHIIQYDRQTHAGNHKYFYTPAKDMVINNENKIHRWFKYVASDEYKTEKVVYSDEFGKHWVTISNEDWFVLAGYVLCRGYIVSRGKRYGLNIYLNNDKLEEERTVLGDILDRMGVKWSLMPFRTIGRWLIFVNADNTLASRIIARLGSNKRREMFLPNKMVFSGSKQLASVLIKTMASTARRPETEDKDFYQISTNNKELLDSVCLLCTLWGFSPRLTIMARAGTYTGRGKLKKDVYSLTIGKGMKLYTVSYINRNNYKGYVYGIDLLDGQVYAKEGSMPVWVNPK